MPTAATLDAVQIRVYDARDLAARLREGDARPEALRRASLSHHPGWLSVFHAAMKHVPYYLEAARDERLVGYLPLALVRSRLFGRFLVSLPYLNTSGVVAEDAGVATLLIDRAVQLADELDVRYLELRHETEHSHPALAHKLTSKVHMRLPLAGTSDAQWEAFSPKVRNQIRKAEKLDLTVHWGGVERLGEFYGVFCRNMRDLGTPVFGRRLFRAIVSQFAGDAEICTVRLGRRAIAAALLIHGDGVTEVPSASSLREHNSTNANMLMYWHLLRRAIQRGQRVFDFGRSSLDSNTYRFKKQWGAVAQPAVWQYYVRRGGVGDMRPENRKYRAMIEIWRRLPVFLTRWIGPAIVRGIP